MRLLIFFICIFVSIYIINLYPPIECNYELVDYIFLDPQIKIYENKCYLFYPIEYRYMISLKNNTNECIEKESKIKTTILYDKPIYIENLYEKKGYIFNDMIIIPFIIFMIGLL
jgi:hypothetical protein